MNDQKGYLTFDNTAGMQGMPARKPFTASGNEVAAAFIMYAAAYIYIDKMLLDVNSTGIFKLIFTGLFVLVTELVCRSIPRSKESILWLSCLGITALSSSFYFDPGSGKFSLGLFSHSVWDTSQLLLFLHLFGMWYVLSRSGRLLENESGHLLPADAFNIFVLFPFSNFVLRLRVVFYSVKTALSGRKKGSLRTALWSLGALIIAAIILMNAVSLLSEADYGFDQLMEKIRLNFEFDLGYDLADFITKFVWSLPVAAYLYGAIAGSARTELTAIETKRTHVLDLVAKLRKVSPKLWLAVISVFSLFYAVFFVLQGEYLFGAFVGKLPEGFIVSHYARQGFFELCKIIALNFSVLWLVTRVSEASTDESRLLRSSCIVFLAESMLFCVIAFSKLMLYIDCYGFTPLRLQSSWLVLVLFTGCIFWTVNLLTGKKVFRKWMITAAVSLCVLTIF